MPKLRSSEIVRCIGCEIILLLFHFGHVCLLRARRLFILVTIATDCLMGLALERRLQSVLTNTLILSLLQNLLHVVRLPGPVYRPVSP